MKSDISETKRYGVWRQPKDGSENGWWFLNNYYDQKQEALTLAKRLDNHGLDSCTYEVSERL